MGFINFIHNHYTDLIQVFTYIVTTASVITKFTKTTKDDEVIGKIRKTVEFLALIPKNK